MRCFGVVGVVGAHDLAGLWVVAGIACLAHPVAAHHAVAVGVGGRVLVVSADGAVARLAVGAGAMSFTGAERRGRW